MLPNRPRSYAQLAYHIFNIADAFLEHEVQDLPLKEGAYGRVPPPEMNTKAKLLAYGQDVLGRFKTWWDGPGQTTDFSRKATSTTATSRCRSIWSGPPGIRVSTCASS